MELDPYLEQLRTDVAAAVALADDATRDVAARVVQAAEPALRLALTAAISDALAETTASLNAQHVPATAQLSLLGRSATVSVELTEPIPQASPTLPLPTVGDETEDGQAARITLRLPASVKARADQAAESEGVSLNSYIVNAVRAATIAERRSPSTRNGRRLSGWI